MSAIHLPLGENKYIHIWDKTFNNKVRLELDEQPSFKNVNFPVEKFLVCFNPEEYIKKHDNPYFSKRIKINGFSNAAFVRVSKKIKPSLFKNKSNIYLRTENEYGYTAQLEFQEIKLTSHLQYSMKDEITICFKDLLSWTPVGKIRGK